MTPKNNSEIPSRNTLCLIKIHTLVEISSLPGRWELPIGQLYLAQSLTEVDFRTLKVRHTFMMHVTQLVQT